MKYDKSLIIHKLLRWEGYLHQYNLPLWKDLPDIGLYMDQVTALLSHYLDFISSANPSERPITPTTINNYVRLKVMPAPIKRKYYRLHIAYLIVIFTLKQSASISSVQQIIPNGLAEEEMRTFYESYARKLQEVSNLFIEQTRTAAQDILLVSEEVDDDAAVDGLIIQTLLMAGFSNIMADKLLQLRGAEKEAIVSTEVPRDEI